MNIILSIEDYKVLYFAEDCGELAQVLNENGAANWTVCPVCGCDYFFHETDCSLQVSLEREIHLR